MATFKCKMCGGNIEFEPGATVGVCDSCGTKQTLPRLDDDKKANLYDRANHFRRNNDFDKAMGIYEQILNEDGTDAEVYWSLVLCRYGVEYVEDPATHRRVPTVNRAQFTSVLADEDYKAALAHADTLQRTVYEAEAHAIDEIQKGILEISQKEEPFDVFICYKETDANGRRTQDSVLATELYHELVREGYKVFFSRITLEDKLGTAYEPYIFAALNSAKVMVALGTKAEHFNAVWVKNEWSRYLALIKNGAKKMLIPAYRDMDPYGLPEEFSHLQAQDMSKLGFMQDLVRGIKKIAGEGNTAPAAASVPTAPTAVPVGGNVAPLLERSFMFLEDENWEKADDLCEQVLNQEPKNAEAYLGKLLAELHIKTPNELKDSGVSFDENDNYQKALRFGDEKLKNTLIFGSKATNERLEQLRIKGVYDEATHQLEYAASEEDYIAASELFKSISDYEDAAEKAKYCLEKAKKRVEQDRLEREEEKMRKKKVVRATVAVIAACAAGVLLFFFAVIPLHRAIRISQLKKEGELGRAQAFVYQMNDGYGKCKNLYDIAVLAIEQKRYVFASECFGNIYDVYDHDKGGKIQKKMEAAFGEKIDASQEILCQKAKEYLQRKEKKENAYRILQQLSGYENALEIQYQEGVRLQKEGKYREAYEMYYYLHYKDAQKRCEEMWQLVYGSQLE